VDLENLSDDELENILDKITVILRERKYFKEFYDDQYYEDQYAFSEH